jgi:phage baseplate assembly protein W
MIPHYAMPLRILNGRFATVDDGSTADVSQSVGLLIATEPGERLSLPAYGVDNALFSTDVNATDIVAQIAKWEKRAGDIGIQVSVDGESVTVNLNATGGS